MKEPEVLTELQPLLRSINRVGSMGAIWEDTLGGEMKWSMKKPAYLFQTDMDDFIDWSDEQLAEVWTGWWSFALNSPYIFFPRRFSANLRVCFSNSRQLTCSIKWSSTSLMHWSHERQQKSSSSSPPPPPLIEFVYIYYWSLNGIWCNCFMILDHNPL